MNMYAESVECSCLERGADRKIIGGIKDIRVTRKRKKNRKRWGGKLILPRILTGSSESCLYHYAKKNLPR